MNSEELAVPSESEVIKKDILAEPPEDQWATFQKKDPWNPEDVIEEFKVPFTAEELEAILSARKLMLGSAIMDGIDRGGPERIFSDHLKIPNEEGLKNRENAVKLLSKTVAAAKQIIAENNFSPGLKSKEAVEKIADDLEMFKIHPRKE